jgi:Dolichyl-phosphate-mannose-protein mannosyltransferase
LSRHGDISPIVFGEYIGTLALALLYVLAMFGWGSLFLRLFRANSGSFWNDFASRIVAGCGFLYAGFIVLSAVSALHRIEVGSFLGVGILASCYFISPFIQSATSQEASTPWVLMDLILAASIGMLITLQLIFALTPLIFYDLQVYHLLAPAEFLRTGSLTHIPWNVLTNSPLAIQLTVGMSLVLDASGQLAKLLYAALGCLICAGTFELIRPAGRRAALLATLFVLSFPEFWIMQTLGVVDLSIAAFMIFGAIWLRQALKDSQWQPAILSGIAFGIAMGSRYQALVLTSVIVVGSVAEHFLRRQREYSLRRVILQLTLVGLIVTLMVCPWLIRNYSHLGNPVYPLMQGIGGANEWSPEQDAQFRADALGPSLRDISLSRKIFSPVMMLFAFPSNIFFGTILLIGSLAALTSPNRELKFAAIIGLSGMTVWGLMRPTAGTALVRFNAVSLILILASTGAALGSGVLLAKAGPKIAALLASASVIIAVIQLHRFLPVTQSLRDPQLRQALHDVNVPAGAAFEYANEHLDPGHDKVLVIGETRGFWLHVPYIAPSAFNGPQLDTIFGGNSAPDIWERRLGQLGISHLLISYPEFQRLHTKYGYLHLPPEGMDSFSHWIQKLPLVFEDGRGTAILALQRVSAPTVLPIAH